jgi:hypothetical protein
MTFVEDTEDLAVVGGGAAGVEPVAEGAVGDAEVVLVCLDGGGYVAEAGDEGLVL